MTHHSITVDSELVQGLFVRDEGLAQLVQQVVNQVLAALATDHVQAAPYERTEERQGYRNGSVRNVAMPMTYVAGQGYQLNLSTSGLAAGQYDLQFTAGADPTVHLAPFTVASHP